MLYSIIAPSILSADFLKLESDIQSVVDGGCDWLHVDIMDGHFVPNLTMGPGLLKCVRKRFPDLFLDVHLMVTDPSRWIKEFYKAGADQLTFHYEAVPHTEGCLDVLRKIKSMGIQAGLSLKPETKVDTIMPIIDNPEKLVDTVLVMTVPPGFGGQRFMQEQLTKVKKLRAKYPDLCIEVDGGINALTSKMSATAGANACVAGSFIFSQDDRKALISQIRHNMEAGYPAPPSRPLAIPRAPAPPGGILSPPAGVLSPTAGTPAAALSPGPLVSEQPPQ